MLMKIVSATLMLIVMGALIAPATAEAPQSSEVHFTKVIVEPSGPDMNFTVYYESSFFTRVFSVLFGAKVVQPSVEHMFANFSNVTIVSIDSNNDLAEVTVKNISAPMDDGWYAYNGNTTFTSKIDLIEVHNSDGRVETIRDADSLPAISNRMPALGTY